MRRREISDLALQRLTRAVAAAVLMLLSARLWAAEPVLAPPPQALVEQSVSMASAKSAALDPLDRAAVVDLYRNFFVLLPQVPSGWNGSTQSCTAGITSPAYRAAVIDRINVYRALAGLPGLLQELSAAETAKAQQAALMMSANNSLSHSPPTTWRCYSADGAQAAGRSNLSLGAAGTEAIDLYMIDPGSFNYFAGHRRWLLYPPLAKVTTGDVTGFPVSNALWVFNGNGSNGPRPATPDGTAWPPRGFVPYAMLPGSSNRWSFSYPSADFSAATVAMQRGGQGVPVTLEAVVDGYGDNTLVWRPQGLSYTKPSTDTAYQIQIGNVRIGGQPRAFAYTVTVIDPDAAGSPPPAPPSLFRNGFD